AKLERHALLNSKVLEECHVEVNPPRVAQEVPSGISKSKPGRQSERGRVVEEFGVTPGVHLACWRDTGAGIANHVRIRTGADGVADPGIVAVSRTVGYRQRR